MARWLLLVFLVGCDRPYPYVPNEVPIDPELDTDGDGAPDVNELRGNGIMNGQITDPFDPDSDDDGLTDAQEALGIGTDPLTWDTDGDGLGDGAEVLHTGTDPLDEDSDGDGVPDGQEA